MDGSDPEPLNSHFRAVGVLPSADRKELLTLLTMVAGSVSLPCQWCNAVDSGGIE